MRMSDYVARLTSPSNEEARTQQQAQVVPVSLVDPTTDRFECLWHFASTSKLSVGSTSGVTPTIAC